MKKKQEQFHKQTQKLAELKQKEFDEKK